MNQNAPSRARRNGSLYLDGAELRRRRKEAVMTQAALAALAGADPKHFPHWEAGHYGCDIGVIIALAAALPGCSPTDLVHEAGRKRIRTLTAVANAA